MNRRVISYVYKVAFIRGLLSRTAWMLSTGLVTAALDARMIKCTRIWKKRRKAQSTKEGGMLVLRSICAAIVTCTT